MTHALDLALMPEKFRELHANGVIDVAIGACTGAPSLPFAATVRVQLVDLVTPLQWLSALDPNEALTFRCCFNILLIPCNGSLCWTPTRSCPIAAATTQRFGPGVSSLPA